MTKTEVPASIFEQEEDLPLFDISIHDDDEGTWFQEALRQLEEE